MTDAPPRSPLTAPPVLGDGLSTLIDVELRDDDEVLDAHVRGGTAADDAVEGVTIRRSRLTGLTLTGVTFTGLALIDVVLEDCELSGTTFDASSLTRVRFERCRMASFTAPNLEASHASFSDCKLTGAWLRMARLERCSFEDCDLGEADLYSARVIGSRIVRCRLDGAEVSQAELDDVAFHGTTITGIQGAAALRNATIGSDQALDFGLLALQAQRVRIDDEYLDPPAP